MIDVADRALLSLCIWSPNAEHIVYVLDNDVYFFRGLQSTVRLTTDGIVGVVYNGVPDWVYEEEVLGSGGAIWVAPNGARLAIASFDDTAVPEFTYTTYGEQYETDVTLRYPKVSGPPTYSTAATTSDPILQAGRTNPSVTLKHIDLNGANPQWNVVRAPLAVVSADHILNSVSWLDDQTFGAIWTNRRQNQSVFQQCNAPSNTCREVTYLQRQFSLNAQGQRHHRTRLGVRNPRADRLDRHQ